MRGRGFIIKRVLLMLPVLFFVMFAVFMTVRLVPGDPLDAMLGGRRISAAADAEMRAQLGLDKPWYTQFWVWCGGVLHGNLGRSIMSRRPVLDEIAAKLPHTIELLVLSLVLAVPVGVTLGILAAIRPRGAVDLLATATSVIGISMPAFWLGLLLLLAFSVRVGWFPTSGIIDPQIGVVQRTGFYVIDSLMSGTMRGLGSFLHHMILPAIVLSTVPLAYVTRMARSSMLDVLREAYVTTARAKGVPERSVIVVHALRNALIPVTIVIGTVTGLLLGGAVLTETIFGLPGMGRLLVDAILQRDFPLIQGCILVFAVGYNIVNLLTDILCQWIDPKAHYG